MARHAIWKGYLRLSLVNCAVALYPATTDASRIHFHKLNRKSGNRLKMHMVDEATGEDVPAEQQARGYEIVKGETVVIEPGDIDKIGLESTHVMEITAFTERRDIDPVFFERPYFLVPDDDASAEAFAVIREAMRQRDVAALCKVVMHEREHILLLEPRPPGILATVLRWPHDMQDEADVMAAVPPPPKMTNDLLDVASHLIDRKMTKFDPATFEDRYEEALKALVAAKRSGKALAAPSHRPAPKGMDVFEALRASLAESDDAAPAEGPAPRVKHSRGASKAGKAAAPKTKAAAPKTKGVGPRASAVTHSK